jgi:hypothetical protein
MVCLDGQNCYHGNISYIVVTVKNDGNVPLTLMEDFTFCDREPFITPWIRECHNDYGICPNASLHITLQPNGTYDFGLLLPATYQEFYGGTVCGKTFNVYLVELKTYKIFDKSSITIHC